MNAYLVGCTEMIGGALFTIGFASRLAAIPLTFTLIVAYLTSEQDALSKLFHFIDINPFLTADPFLFMFACLIILAFGPGIFSVDYLIERSGNMRTPVLSDLPSHRAYALLLPAFCLNRRS